MGMGYRRGPQRGGFGSPGLLNPQVVSIFTNLFLQVRADNHVQQSTSCSVWLTVLLRLWKASLLSINSCPVAATGDLV